LQRKPIFLERRSESLKLSAESARPRQWIGLFSEKPHWIPSRRNRQPPARFYAHDTVKWTKSFTANFGLRYNWNSSLSNHGPPANRNLGLFDRNSRASRTPADNFGPQAGFAWNVIGNNKLSSCGAGLYYETNIFNNLLFDRVLNIPPGLGNDTPIITVVPHYCWIEHGKCAFRFQLAVHRLAGNTCIGAALGQVIPFALQGSS